MTKLVSKSAQSEFSDEQVSNFLDRVANAKRVSFIDEVDFELLFSYYDGTEFHEFRFAFTQFDTSSQLLEKYFEALYRLKAELEEKAHDGKAMQETYESLMYFSRI